MNQPQTGSGPVHAKDRLTGMVVLTCETTITMDRPARYLGQFCRHAAAMGQTGGGHRARGHAAGAALAGGEVSVQADYTDTHGVVTITPWGRCALNASPGMLTIRVEATGHDELQQIQNIITRDLERFGRRDNLTVTWPPPRPAGSSGLPPIHG